MTNQQQITLRTLDLISDAAHNAIAPVEQQRCRVLEYALELAVKGSPTQIFKYLKAKTDALHGNAIDLLEVAGDTWCNAAKLDLKLMQSA